MRSWFAVTAVLAAMAVAGGSVNAMPLSGAVSKSAPAMSDNTALDLVQYRHDGPPPGQGPRRGPNRGYRGGRGGGDGDGGAVAAGVLGGLFLGAIIANQAQRQNGADYCVQRYRSYDPRSGTYLGNDGRRHRCP